MMTRKEVHYSTTDCNTRLQHYTTTGLQQFEEEVQEP